MRKMLIEFWVFVVLGIPTLVFAVDAPPLKFTQEHSDAVAWAFGLVLGGFLILLWRMISQNDKKFDKNSEEHEAMLQAMKDESEKKWNAIGNLTRDLGAAVSELNRLKGEHDVLKGVHLHRRVDDQ